MTVGHSSAVHKANGANPFGPRASVLITRSLLKCSNESRWSGRRVAVSTAEAFEAQGLVMPPDPAQLSRMSVRKEARSPIV